MELNLELEINMMGWVNTKYLVLILEKMGCMCPIIHLDQNSTLV